MERQLRSQGKTVKKEKNMRPLISIIVPVYNGENFIEKCIKSILNQSLNELQIIIVNDGSSDNTAAILEK